MRRRCNESDLHPSPRRHRPGAATFANSLTNSGSHPEMPMEKRERTLSHVRVNGGAVDAGSVLANRQDRFSVRRTFMQKRVVADRSRQHRHLRVADQPRIPQCIRRRGRDRIAGADHDFYRHANVLQIGR